MHCRINRTLEHMRDITDYYTIVDTASEDNTVETVKELMSGVPGQIINHGSLQSFADARNQAFTVRPTHAVNSLDAFLSMHILIDLARRGRSWLSAAVLLGPPQSPAKVQKRWSWCGLSLTHTHASSSRN